MLNNLLKYRQFGFSTQYRNLFNTCRSHHLQQNGRIFVKSFHCSVHMHSTDDTTKKDQIKHEIAPNIATKYERFTDDKATIILDMEEEREKLQTAKSLDVEVVDDTASHMFEGLNTEHGQTGVFDIEDLVAVLKRDNAIDIFVCRVSKQLKYVDYMVVITARSHRHMKAMAEFVKKMYKMKMNHNVDVVPKIEGKNSDEWIAMDLGNIALHIFSAKVRKQYDLEMLWSVGADYDTETNKPDDPIYDLFDQHSMPLSKFMSSRKSRVIGDPRIRSAAAAAAAATSAEHLDDNEVNGR